MVAVKGTRLGFIGLGAMGFPIASRLAKAGYPLAIFDVNKSTLESFKGKDILLQSSPKDVADNADIILVSLPSPNVVKEVTLGRNGVIQGNRVKIYIDLSTSGETMASEVGKHLLNKGIQVLDSPISGGVVKAQNGMLSLMVAGDKEIYEQCQHIFNHIGNKHFYIGDKVGQAQVMKGINNLLS